MVEKEIFSNRKEGTVFDYKIILKGENITKNGFFNLKKIENLRIIDNGFLKKIRKDFNFKQKDIANILRVPLRTVIGWEAYKKAMPYNLLIELFNRVGLDENESSFLIRGSEFSFGKHHGKNRIKLPLKPEEFVILKYFRPLEPDKVYLVRNTPKKLKKEFITQFSIDKTYFDKTGLVVIYSFLLNKFLKTFYDYKKILKLSFPLSKEVPEWMKSNVDLIKAVIIPLLITDGGEKPACVFCSGESNIVNEIWSDAWYYKFNLLPSSYKFHQNGILITSHKPSIDFLNKIKDISPSFKTSPVDESLEEYFRLPQPDLSYLFDISNFEQQIAIRLFAITEGSISIHNNKRSGLITPCLRIACAHPKLIEQLKKVMEINNINMSKIKGYTTWSKLSGLQTTSICSITKFLKIGGFIRGVKVSKLKSKYFGGSDKQDVLLAILEFMKKQREDLQYRFLTIAKINKDIRNIILNKRFKDEEYYINYFKKC